MMVLMENYDDDANFTSVHRRRRQKLNEKLISAAISGNTEEMQFIGKNLQKQGVHALFFLQILFGKSSNADFSYQ